MLTGTATAAVLVGAVELNAYTVRYLQQRSKRKSEKSDTQAKKMTGAKANTPVTVYPLDDSAEQQERERLATKLATTKEGLYGTTL